MLPFYFVKGIHLPRKRYTVATQKVYSCLVKGIQLQRKRYTVATQKVYSCGAEDFFPAKSAEREII